MRNETGMQETRPFHLGSEQFHAFLKDMNRGEGMLGGTNPMAPHSVFKEESQPHTEQRHV